MTSAPTALSALSDRPLSDRSALVGPIGPHGLGPNCPCRP